MADNYRNQKRKWFYSVKIVYFIKQILRNKRFVIAYTLLNKYN